MKIAIGDRLHFWNKQHNCIDYITVTDVSSDGKGFQFLHLGKIYRCTYDRAVGKLFRSPYYVSEYRAYLMHEADERSRLNAEYNKREAERFAAAVRKSRDEASYQVKIANITVEKSCDNCRHNRSGACTAVRKSLCDDYAPGNLRDSEQIQKGQWV